MTGNPSLVVDNIRFLLDESLVPTVGDALSLVGYEFVHCDSGTKDPDIIKFCEEHDVIWIHFDDSSRKEHRKLLQTSGIRTLWVYRPGGKMSARQQLRILSYVLPILAQNLVRNPRIRHYKANSADEISKITLRPYDV